MHEAEKDAGLVVGPFSAFSENLYSAILVGSIPFQLVHTSVLQQRFYQIHTAARIRTLTGDGSKPEPEAEQTAYQIAHDQMNEELRDNEIIGRHAKATLDTLDRHFESDDNFSGSTSELLRQVIVIAWGAFETLVNDGIRIVLNNDPNKILRVAGDKIYNDAIFGKNLIDKLEKRTFNL